MRSAVVFPRFCVSTMQTTISRRNRFLNRQIVLKKLLDTEINFFNTSEKMCLNSAQNVPTENRRKNHHTFLTRGGGYILVRHGFTPGDTYTHDTNKHTSTLYTRHTDTHYTRHTPATHCDTHAYTHRDTHAYTHRDTHTYTHSDTHIDTQTHRLEHIDTHRRESERHTQTRTHTHIYIYIFIYRERETDICTGTHTHTQTQTLRHPPNQLGLLVDVRFVAHAPPHCSAPNRHQKQHNKV